MCPPDWSAVRTSGNDFGHGRRCTGDRPVAVTVDRSASGAGWCSAGRSWTGVAISGGCRPPGASTWCPRCRPAVLHRRSGYPAKARGGTHRSRRQRTRPDRTCEENQRQSPGDQLRRRRAEQRRVDHGRPVTPPPWRAFYCAAQRRSAAISASLYTTSAVRHGHASGSFSPGVQHSELHHTSRDGWFLCEGGACRYLTGSCRARTCSIGSGMNAT